MFDLLRKDRLDELLSALWAFGRLTRSPTIDNAVTLRERLTTLAGPEGLREVAGALERAPELAKMFAGRYLAPAYRIEDLARCAPGTLGQAYHRFMTEHGLALDAIPRPRPVDVLSYYRRRTQETHDIWHVVLGYGPDLPGEVGVLSFLVGHVLRSVKPEGLTAARFPAMVVLAFLGHAITHQPRALAPSLRALQQGLRRGLSTPPLWAVRWEEMWDRPLLAIQAEHALFTGIW